VCACARPGRLQGKAAMEERRSFYDLDEEERCAVVRECGGASYTEKQVHGWVFRRMTYAFERMTDIPGWVREELSRRFRIVPGELDAAAVSRDGTLKALVRFRDGVRVECVAIPLRAYWSFCVSTMAGCPVGCRFCASGKDGLIRRLSAGEMLAQYLLLARRVETYPRTVVLMGSGEPLLNFDEVWKFLSLLNHPDMGGLGARRITVSTVGIPRGIERLARGGKQFELALSLHHPRDAERRRIVPVKHPLGEILEKLVFYRHMTGRIPTFEYCLLRGVNDSPACAREAADLAHRVPAKVNLIPYNDWNPRYTSSSPEVVDRFRKILASRGVPVTVRRRRGDDIRAACGQLTAERRG